ncbi:hypothetical protein [Nostoc sp.]
MIGTNIYISQETQESLIKAAAFKKMSVEELVQVGGNKPTIQNSQKARN